MSLNKQKPLRNFKVFAPKRKFNRPRNSTPIASGDEFRVELYDGFKLLVKNTSKRQIFVRYE